MSSPDANGAKAMVNIFDSEGNRVTGDLKPGKYNLVLETENLVAAVGAGAVISLVMHLTIDKNDIVTVSRDAVVASDGEENIEMSFSIDKWMKKIHAIALLHVGNAQFQGYLFWMDELHQNVTSQYRRGN